MIYTVTVHTRDLRDHRTWGWFPTFEQARHAVLHDQTDMQECLYQWACIEEIPSGIGCGEAPVWWGRWNESKRAWVKCRVPKGWENVVGYAMG